MAGGALVDLCVRWLHIAGVIVWLGHNWSNVVRRPRYRRALPDDAPRETPEEALLAASRREHGVFRYASVVVLGTGLTLLARRGVLREALTLQGPTVVLGVGVWLGVAMACNLWLVLWPHQRKVLGFVPAPLEERLRCTRVTFLSSRVNSVLSLPTLFCMVVGSHDPWALHW
ncbi:MAG: hypothetical protein HY909_03975 [Deltaproteobacteria bacterium]|nr:hypothetical protein [Deltaproteobacteria bacterium]